MRLYGQKGEAADPDRLARLKANLHIQDTGSGEKAYIKTQLSQAWQALRKVQKGSAEKRASHVDILAQHYADERYTTKDIEITKIQRSEKSR